MTTQNPGSTNPSPADPLPTVPMLRLREALEAVRPEAAAVEQDDFLPIALDIPQATITVRGCVPELQGIRDRIVAALPTFDIERFDKLERYALALWQAHTQYIGASRPTAPIPEITEELKGIRDQLVLDMQGLAKRRLIDGTRIADLKGTTGSKNIASDVLVLAAVLRDSWAQLQGQTAIKLSELDHAEQLADTLHSALALKEQSHAKVSDAAELRQRCYTLMLNAYDDARRAVIFLRWKENDADEIAPSLFAGRKRASTGEEEAPAAPGTQPAPGSEIGTAPVAPPAQPAQGNGGGMPVISPFTNT